MIKKRTLVCSTAGLAAALFAVWACATVQTDVAPETNAQIVSSPAFTFRPGLRVAVMPFTVLGNPNRTEDISEADRLGMKLRSFGFVIVESLILQEEGGVFRGLTSQEEDLDFLVFGTINYAYEPAHSLAGKGRYYPRSASIRLVDAKTGEVVIIAYLDRIEGSVAEVVSESVFRQISQQE